MSWGSTGCRGRRKRGRLEKATAGLTTADGPGLTGRSATRIGSGWRLWRMRYDAPTTLGPRRRRSPTRRCARRGSGRGRRVFDQSAHKDGRRSSAVAPYIVCGREWGHGHNGGRRRPLRGDAWRAVLRSEDGEVCVGDAKLGVNYWLVDQ